MKGTIHGKMHLHLGVTHASFNARAPVTLVQQPVYRIMGLCCHEGKELARLVQLAETAQRTWPRHIAR